MKQHYSKDKKVEMIAVESLIPHPTNAKKHAQKQVDLLVDLIGKFGFTAPLLIDENNGILAGHGRTIAAKQMKLKEVPCIRIEGLTEEEKRALILADNRSSEVGGGWDIDLLQQEISFLQEAGFDLNFSGFDSFAVSELFATDEVAGGEDGDDSPEFKEYDENIETTHECPKCGYKWSGSSK